MQSQEGSEISSNQKDCWRILLVEDDEDDFVYLLSLIEEAAGCSNHIDWVREIAQVNFAQLCSKNYDVGLIDHKLNSHSGIEFIEKAKTACTELPLILMTTWPDFETVAQEAKDKGAHAILHKTHITRDILMEHLVAAVNHKGKRG